MKQLIKSVLDRAVQVDALWNLLESTVIRVAFYAQAARRAVYEQAQRIGPGQAPPPSSIDPPLAGLTVRHGVFAGMKYPSMKAIGSQIYPKLLGSYEREIQPLLERLCSKNYSEIVDVGCAEGYYAVGLAMRIPGAKVFAFDTNRDAVELCERMARVNGVSDRLFTGRFCDPSTLKNLPLTEKALILSDCEGYEKTLFTGETARLLARHDLLIEVHDFVDIEISAYLRRVFGSTHTVESYSSIDDIQKAHLYSYPELDGLDLAARKRILAEHRPAIMEWLYMQPRNG
jgi:SAM-dependent methyltransferase